MKRFYLIIFFNFIVSSLLIGHGFGARTIVYQADNSCIEMKQLCYSSRHKKTRIATYCKAHGIGQQKIKKCGKSKIEQFVRFGFSNLPDIVCTLTQEFFLFSTQQWVPAYRLKKGDLLFCKNGPRVITSIEFVKKTIDVYLFELQKVHTFFVGYYGALTHNMELPMAWGLGASISFGAGAGGSTGSFFGPATFALGCLAGALIGLCIELVKKDSVKKYSLNNVPLHFFDKSTQNSDSSSVSSFGGSLSPMPDGPKKDDEEDKNKIKISEKDKSHIFRNSDGHFPKDTPEVRQLIENVVNDTNNYRGTTMYNVDIYLKELVDGRQIWSQVAKGKVTNAGINNFIAYFDPTLPSGIRVPW